MLQSILKENYSYQTSVLIELYLKKLTFAYIIIKRNTKERVKAMATRDKNIWILLIFILSGVVLGGLLGELAARVDFLSWLAYGQEFGLQDPIVLDLSILKITFGLMIKINVASIVGIALAILLYRKF